MHFFCKVYSEIVIGRSLLFFFQEVPQMRLLRGSATVVPRQANEDEIKEATSLKKCVHIGQWPVTLACLNQDTIPEAPAPNTPKRCYMRVAPWAKTMDFSWKKKATTQDRLK